MPRDETNVQDVQPEPQPEPQMQPTIFDQLQYAFDGLLACIRADDPLRAMMFAGILIRVASTLQVECCQHLVDQMPSKATLPGLHEEVTVFAGMEGTING